MLLEVGTDHPAGQASITHIDFASSWHIPMKGAIVLAAVGDLDAGLRAKKMARTLIDQDRPAAEPLAGDTAG